MGVFDWLGDLIMPFGKPSFGKTQQAASNIVGGGPNWAPFGGPSYGAGGTAARGDISSAIRPPQAPQVPQQPQQSTTDQILQQLQALQDPGRYLQSDAALHQQAALMAGAKYDPIIAALRNQAAASTKRGEQSQKDVISIFNQLSDNLHGDLPVIQQQYDTTQQQTGKEYADLKSGIQQQYQDSQKQQAQMYKDLNIQAAAPGILPQQQRDQDYFTNRASTDAQTQQTALTTERQGAVDYTNRKSQNARTEGTQRSADILSNLNALLEQYNGQIGINTAAKSQEEFANYSTLAGQNQSNAMDRAQRDFSNYIQSINVGRGLKSDELDQAFKQFQMGQQQNKPVQSLADIPNRVIGLGLNQGSAQKVQNIMTTGLTDDVISGGLDPNTGQQATPEAKVSQLMERGRINGLSNQELDALRVAALEYFGRR